MRTATPPAGAAPSLPAGPCTPPAKEVTSSVPWPAPSATPTHTSPSPLPCRPVPPAKAPIGSGSAATHGPLAACTVPVSLGVAPRPPSGQSAPQGNQVTSSAPWPQNQPLALLSFFNGIGTAELALQDLGVKPIRSYSWEVDRACTSVITSHFPDTKHMGSFDACSVPGTLAMLAQECPLETMVLITSAPPCVDFSTIKGPGARGTEGPEGSKFAEWASWLMQFLAACPLKVLFIVENVVMAAAFQAKLNALLRCSCFLVDAADWGVVSRPRLWWSNALCPPESLDADPPQVFGGIARWKRWNRLWQLVPASNMFPAQVAAACPFGEFHSEILAGRARFPCLTTPAPTPAGRPPPAKKKRSESPGTMSRWERGCRQYPPWQFRLTALVKIGAHWQVPDPTVREWLHGFPSGFTASLDTRDRCRVIGNSWHVPVARFILFLLLSAASPPCTTAAPCDPWYPSTASVCGQCKWHPDGSRPLVRVASWWLRSGLTWDPKEPTLTSPTGPAADPLLHFQWASRLCFDSVFPIQLNQCISWCYEMQSFVGPNLPQIRKLVCDDLLELLLDTEAEQTHWLSQAPEHVRKVYRQGTDRNQLQLLVLARLLDLICFPEAESLISEMFWGFRMLGPLLPGAAWDLREDSRYARPWTKSQFLHFNRAHLEEVSKPSPPSCHLPVMLAEVQKEKDLGRFEGPFPLSTLSEPTPPDQLNAVAKAFPIVQTSEGVTKVRRGDDWKRSGHNSTIWAQDAPPHCGTQSVLQAVRHWHRHSQGATLEDRMPLIAACDHEGAYRMLPVRCPNECFVLFPGPHPELWRHNCLTFGAVASVWAYVKVADVLCALAIILLLCASSHFVDDFFNVEARLSAESAFLSFQQFHRCLGFKMKESKAKAPSSELVLLGLQWTLSSDEVQVGPVTNRVAKLCSAITEVLASGAMSAHDASHLSGKLMFVCSWVTGAAGRSLLKPLYKRQHSGPAGPQPLNRSLRVALECLLRLLPNLAPLKIPLGPAAQAPIQLLYADAFITLGPEVRFANRFVRAATPLHDLRGSSNGWGAAFFDPSGCRLCFRGEVPKEVLASAASSKAYIFWLEAVAQILALLVVSELLHLHVLCFCDNTAAEHALAKGMTSDAALTTVLGGFWAWASARGLRITFIRVTSESNLSDGPSRGDMSQCLALGCTEVHLNLDPVWHLLLRAHQGGRGASADLFDEMAVLLSAQCAGVGRTGALGGGDARRQTPGA